MHDALVLLCDVSHLIMLLKYRNNTNDENYEVHRLNFVISLCISQWMRWDCVDVKWGTIWLIQIQQFTCFFCNFGRINAWVHFPLLFGGTGPSLESIGAKKFGLVSGQIWRNFGAISQIDGGDDASRIWWWPHKRCSASVDASGCWQEAAEVRGDLEWSHHRFECDGWGRRVFFMQQLAEYMTTHLLLVQFGPFQRGSFVFDWYPDVEMWEEVGSTTTGGEWVWRSFVMAGRFFSM
jgi:hypothetical protein